MALPTAAPRRTLKHRRLLDLQVFARGDGLWEVDARLTDVRSADVQLATGVRRAGDPVHDMLLRLVVDERFNITGAGADYRAMPYPGSCDAVPDAYGAMVGLNLLRSFRRELHERLGGVRGCTHLTELAQTLPTAVIQAFAGEVIDTRGESPSSERPFQIDRCQALRADGPAVLAYYPRWHRPVVPRPEISAEPERARTS